MVPNFFGHSAPEFRRKVRPLVFSFLAPFAARDSFKYKFPSLLLESSAVFVLLLNPFCPGSYPWEGFLAVRGILFYGMCYKTVDDSLLNQRTMLAQR